jgi:hypothetical protein
MVTNTPANGARGIIYKFVPVPEPASLTLAAAVLGAGLALVRGLRRGMMPR